MNAIIVLMLLDTIAQLYFCHFSLWWLLSLLCRLVFCLRILGVTVKVKKLAVAEALVCGAMLLFDSLFHKGGIPWLHILIYLVFSLVSVGLQYLDDLLYVYVVEDLDEDEY